MRFGVVSLPLSVFLLVLGAISGLARGGVVNLGYISAHHWLIFISFFGTLISFERAVALKNPLFFITPLTIFAGLAAKVFAGAGQLLALGSALFFVQNVLRPKGKGVGLGYSNIFFPTGGFLFLLGVLMESFAFAVLSLVFFVLGERLELAKMFRLKRYEKLVLASAGLLSVSGALLHSLDAPPQVALRIFGLGLWGFGTFFIFRDFATKVLRAIGKTRFPELTLYSSVAILLGHAQLCAGGLALALGVRWDVALHSITLGFLFSMVFGHAPVIFPQLVGATTRWSKAFWVPLIFLHVSVVLRWIGYVAVSEVKAVALVSNTVAVLMFFPIFALNTRKRALVQTAR